MIEGLVDGNGPVDVTGLFQFSRTEQHQAARFRVGFETCIQNVFGRVIFAVAAQLHIKLVQGGFGFWVAGDNVAQFGF